MGAYVCYRPDLGYVQGMSFIAAILLLNLEEAEAFIVFANLVNRPLLAAFYRVIEKSWITLPYLNRVAKTCQPCQPAGANFWAKHAKNHTTMSIAHITYTIEQRVTCIVNYSTSNVFLAPMLGAVVLQ